MARLVNYGKACYLWQGLVIMARLAIYGKACDLLLLWQGLLFMGAMGHQIQGFIQFITIIEQQQGRPPVCLCLLCFFTVCFCKKMATPEKHKYGILVCFTHLG